MSLYEEIQQKVFSLLGQLPDHLTYHSLSHTAYVVEQAELIAQAEGVDPEDLLLIKIGALCHDIGFILQYQDHEEAGCDLARKVLDEYAPDQSSIDEVCKMIMATKAGNMPLTHREMIVKDADLEYLGTELFFPNSRLLYTELRHFNPELNERTFRDMQIRFMSGHVYYTDFCRKHREEKKQEHLQYLLRIE